MDKPRQTLAYLIAAMALVFGSGYCVYVWTTVSSVELSVAALVVLILKTSIEVIASTYGIAFFCGAIAYVLMRDAAPGGLSLAEPPVGIVYLCCDDADGAALNSLASLSYKGSLFLIIHDDSRHERARRAVDRMAADLRDRRAWDVRVLRRPDKTGGKAGAVNYALSQTGHLYEYLLLCDNDSQVLAADTVERGLAHFGESTGAVQFRCVPVNDPSYCGANRRLSASIGAFHAFLAPAARYGWMPFIGHNAMLRTRAVQQVGGLTPGFFSDDLDLTVRLNLQVIALPMRPASRWERSIRPATPHSENGVTNGRTGACRHSAHIGGLCCGHAASRSRKNCRSFSSPGSIACSAYCWCICASSCSPCHSAHWGPSCPTSCRACWWGRSWSVSCMRRCCRFT